MASSTKSGKKGEITFYIYYTNLLGVKERVEVREKILAGCGISYPAFYAKIRRRNFNFLEKKEIEKILERSFVW